MAFSNLPGKFHSRELLSRHLSRDGMASTGAATLKHALVARFGTPRNMIDPFLLRWVNGLVFTSRDCARLIRICVIKRKFIALC